MCVCVGGGGGGGGGVARWAGVVCGWVCVCGGGGVGVCGCVCVWVWGCVCVCAFLEAVKGILQDLLTRSALNFQKFLILT